MHPALATIGLLTLASAEPPPQNSVEGRWINPARTVIVEIAQCNDALCGTVQ